MAQNTHIENQDLQNLLDGQSSQSLSRRIEAHIEQCNLCREQLEQLAAEPDAWRKASTLLSYESFGETVAINSQRLENVLDEQDLVESGFELASRSITDCFEPPSHPEMLGRLGQYEIEREIGRGGMGIVFKAHDTELNRPVAIKMMAPHLAASGAARKRFSREARAAAAVLHPNVIAIHGVSRAPENSSVRIPYLVMPFIAGPSLEQVVAQQGPLEEKEIVRIGMQISAGLAAAHSQGLVHRDVKPANVLIERGVSRVVITDFGLARAEDDASMTQTGWFAGTPNYMSPEQSVGRDVDQRSDLFSLGAVLYFAATGRMPFRADQPMAVLERIRTEQPTPVRQVNSDISKTLSNIIQRLLQKLPDDRFQNAAEVHQVLEQYLAYLHRPDGLKKPVVKTARRNRWRWHAGTVATAIFLLVLVTGVVGWWPFTSTWFSRNVYPSSKNTINLGPIIESLTQKYGIQSDSEFLNDIRFVEQAIAEYPYRSAHQWSSESNASLKSEMIHIENELLRIERSIDHFARQPEAIPIQSVPSNQEKSK